jgi:hypothetical protein
MIIGDPDPMTSRLTLDICGDAGQEHVEELRARVMYADAETLAKTLFNQDGTTIGKEALCKMLKTTSETLERHGWFMTYLRKGVKLATLLGSLKASLSLSADKAGKVTTDRALHTAMGSIGAAYLADWLMSKINPSYVRRRQHEIGQKVKEDAERMEEWRNKCEVVTAPTDITKIRELIMQADKYTTPAWQFVTPSGRLRSKVDLLCLRMSIGKPLIVVPAAPAPAQGASAAASAKK